MGQKREQSALHKPVILDTRWTGRILVSENQNTNHDAVVRELLNFAEKKPHSVAGDHC